MTIALTGEGGKGSSQRPTNRELYEKNWDNIFGKKDIIEEAHPIIDDKIPTAIDVYNDI